MSSLGDVPVGLRERKKARTRAALREHAMRLFAERGFGATTVEQIAEAAEVSPSTFFRYFPAKEDVVLADEIDPVFLRAVRDQPLGETPLATIRASITAALATLPPAELEREQQRHQLMRSVPELRGAFTDELRRTIDLLAEATAEKFGAAGDDVQTRAFAGAVVGVVLSVTATDGAFDYADIVAALELLEAGLPLRPEKPARGRTRRTAS